MNEENSKAAKKLEALGERVRYVLMRKRLRTSKAFQAVQKAVEEEYLKSKIKPLSKRELALERKLLESLKPGDIDEKKRTKSE